jgi:GNAT superfamily N-acetyltransferase
MDVIEQLSLTYAWYQGVGHHVDPQPLATFVHDAAHPNIWVANHVSGVRAAHPDDIDQVLDHADRVLAHSSHRFAIIDPMTPPAFAARLAIADYREMAPTIQMVLDGPLSRPGASLALRPVTSDADWQVLYDLARADQLEARRTHGVVHDEEVTRGLVAGYRGKRAASQFFVATVDGVDCAYGSSVIGPYGMGIVEDLFTLQAYRRRGVATAMIDHAVRFARERGMGPMLIGALADETAKHLYARLGFVPRCLTRHYLFDSSR